MNEVTIALGSAFVSVLGTIIVQWLISRSNTKVANIESYPDLAEQLTASISQNMVLVKKMQEQSTKFNDATEQLKEAKTAMNESNANLVKATAVIREMVTEVKRIGGDASIGIDYLKGRNRNEG
ncbi:MAG: hypothetical protein LKG79_07585 [Furfurilactobacillus sp.]|uniref:hypothetical protein n=1 Tax=Furfurilactobacillus sp. TaxID=2767911 RepID=UPI00258743EB|nr:hypothetical protein [Furfurilactobacillus sp.]MCH4010608.1 hypothetical protein [Furfurilactobacillus sp.]MCH4036500.1 hypothetical protein [Furfurilactobacillus sp.]MCH4114554.1 hypothetical protein [Furfurilactobacillus sp.]MCH4133827.1 hypothetical protein [Furfurilactobacillus sp.]MCI1340136.1 hypothetical protein [Furfurilactobacillus sp.]